MPKDEYISNYEYIDTSILWIYRIYPKYIDENFEKKISIDLKFIKI